MKPTLPLLALHLAISTAFVGTAFAADGHTVSSPTAWSDLNGGSVVANSADSSAHCRIQ